MAFPLVFWFLVFPPVPQSIAFLELLPIVIAAHLGRPLVPSPSTGSYAITVAWLLSSTLVLPDPPASCTCFATSLTPPALIASPSRPPHPGRSNVAADASPASFPGVPPSRSCHGPASVSDPSGPSPVVGYSLITSVTPLLADGLAPSTRQTYSTGQRLFADFCAMARLAPLPADEWSLMLFITWLYSVRHLSPATVSVYLASVRSLHVDRGFPDLSRIPRVSIVFFVAFSVRVRLPVPLVSQLPNPSCLRYDPRFPRLCSTIACFGLPVPLLSLGSFA